jgi:hypothetical protein
LGNVLRKINRESEAIAAYQNARELYQSMGIDANVQNCDNAIQEIEKSLVNTSDTATVANPP